MKKNGYFIDIAKTLKKNIYVGQQRRGCTQTLATIEEFWDRTNGATEEEWNKNFNFYCKKCNYKTKNFKEFIPKFNKSNKDSIKDH